MGILISVVTLAVMVSAIVDLIRIDDGRVKHLPKFGWIIIVILLPLVGSVLWFGIGREYASRGPALGSFGDPRRRERSVAAAGTGMSETERELARLDAEIAEAERQDRIRRLERELRERREGGETAS